MMLYLRPSDALATSSITVLVYLDLVRLARSSFNPINTSISYLDPHINCKSDPVMRGS